MKRILLTLAILSLTSPAFAQYRSSYGYNRYRSYPVAQTSPYFSTHTGWRAAVPHGDGVTYGNPTAMVPDRMPLFSGLDTPVAAPATPAGPLTIVNPFCK